MRLVRLVIEAEAGGRVLGALRTDFFSSGGGFAATGAALGAGAGALVFAAALVAAGPGAFADTGGLR